MVSAAIFLVTDFFHLLFIDPLTYAYEDEVAGWNLFPVDHGRNLVIVSFDLVCIKEKSVGYDDRTASLGTLALLLSHIVDKVHQRRL